MSRKSHRRHKRSKVTVVEPGKNKYYQLMVGVVLGAGNITSEDRVGDINNCLPAEWGVAVDNGKLAIDAAKGSTEAAKKAVEEATAAKSESKTEPLAGFATKILESATSAQTAAKDVADSANTAAGKAGSPAATTEDPAKAGDAAADEGKAKEGLEKTADKSTFTKVLDIIQRIVDFVCKFKDKVKGLFSRKYKVYMMKMKNKKYMRFIQKRRSQYLMSSKGFWEDATGFFDKVGDGIHKAWDDVKDIGAWVFKKIKDKIDEAIAWVKKIIEHPFIKKVQQAIECIKNNKDIALNLITTVKGIIARIALLASGTPLGIATVFIDLICNIGKFRDAFSFLDDAKKEANALIQWKKYGLFVGKLFYALGN